MGNGSGVSRGDRNRNARLARLRVLVPATNAIVGIDLADNKQMVVVTDHDSKVLARKTFRCRAWDLGAALDWAGKQASSKDFAGVTVACEPTGHRWRVLGQLAGERGMPFVCVQPMLTSWARRSEDLTFDKTDEKDAVIIARLAAQLRCYVPEPIDETWGRLRHLGARREQLLVEAGVTTADALGDPDVAGRDVHIGCRGVCDGAFGCYRGLPERRWSSAFRCHILSRRSSTAPTPRGNPVVLPVPRIVRAASIAALFTTVSAVPAAPAWASDGVDLRPSFTAPTFGAGSSLNLGSFAITNSGPVAATNVTFTIDLLSDGGTPALTFAGQLNGCTVVSASRLTCPMPDAPAGGSSAYRYGSFSAKVIETHPVPGAANPVPMPIRVRVSVSAAEHELNPADNVTISTPVMRTVSSPPTDWVADAKPGRGKVGESVDIQVGAINRGPRGVAVGETIYTYVAPSGTEWETDLPSWCFEVRPRVEYRCTSTGENPPEPGPIQYGRVRLKILNLIVGDGEFRVESMGGDINPADNAAKIVVDVEGAPPRQTPTSAAQPSHPGGATGGSGGSGGGSGLPVTGTQTALIAAVGAGIVLAGAILLLVGRRRRVRLETPAD